MGRQYHFGPVCFQPLISGILVSGTYNLQGTYKLVKLQLCHLQVLQAIIRNQPLKSGYQALENLQVMIGLPK